MQGYTLNQRRLQERGIEFDQAVSLLSQTLTNQQLVSEQGCRGGAGGGGLRPQLELVASLR